MEKEKTIKSSDIQILSDHIDLVDKIYDEKINELEEETIEDSFKEGINKGLQYSIQQTKEKDKEINTLETSYRWVNDNYLNEIQTTIELRKQNESLQIAVKAQAERINEQAKIIDEKCEQSIQDALDYQESIDELQKSAEEEIDRINRERS